MLGNYYAFFQYYCNQDDFYKCLLDLYLDSYVIGFILMATRSWGQKAPISNFYLLLGPQPEIEICECLNRMIKVQRDDPKQVLLKETYQKVIICHSQVCFKFSSQAITQSSWQEYYCDIKIIIVGVKNYSMFQNNVRTFKMLPVESKQRKVTDFLCTIISSIFALTLFVLSVVLFRKGICAVT